MFFQKTEFLVKTVKKVYFEKTECLISTFKNGSLLLANIGKKKTIFLEREKLI